MKRRTIIEVFCGFAVVAVICTSYYIKDKKSIDFRVKQPDDISRQTSYDRVLNSSNESFNSLDFSSIPSLLGSLRDVIGLQNTDRVLLNYVYDIGTDSLLSEYSTSDNLLTIVSNEKSIVCCRFNTDSEILRDCIESALSANLTNTFVCKETFEGFVLEK